MTSNRRIIFPQLGKAGRLGNQMWQIASTLGIARTRGAEPLFPTGWPYQRWFSCPDYWFQPTARNWPDATRFARHLVPRLRVYLQDLSLWEHCSDEVRLAFTLSDEANSILGQQWAQLAELPGPRIAVHVRRGDYVTNPPGTLNPLPLHWYDKAISNLRGTVIVFTDDPEWCGTHYPGDLLYRGTIVPKPDEPGYDPDAPVLDWIDMFLMARCDHHVISNSSFSWWSAWLADDADTIYPSQWGLDHVDPGWWRRCIPASWREVEVD